MSLLAAIVLAGTLASPSAQALEGTQQTQVTQAPESELNESQKKEKLEQYRLKRIYRQIIQGSDTVYDSRVSGSSVVTTKRELGWVDIHTFTEGGKKELSATEFIQLTNDIASIQKRDNDMARQKKVAIVQMGLGGAVLAGGIAYYFSGISALENCATTDLTPCELVKRDRTQSGIVIGGIGVMVAGYGAIRPKRLQAEQQEWRYYYKPGGEVPVMQHYNQKLRESMGLQEEDIKAYPDTEKRRAELPRFTIQAMLAPNGLLVSGTF